MKRQTSNPVADTVPSSGADGTTDSGTKPTAEGGEHASGAVPSAPLGCLSDDEVLAFVHGGMSRQLLERVDGHIDGCAHCFEVIRAATPDAEIMEAFQGFGG